MIARTFAAILFATSAMAEDRALVIGIDDYSALDGAPQLNGAVYDANQIEATLTGPLGFAPDQIIKLTDTAAHYDAILSNTIDRLVSETSAGDRVFFYFAGMGTTLPDGSQALLAHNGDDVLGRIPMSTIADILEVISDRDTTVVIDTSFDGGPLGTRGIAGGVASGTIDIGAATLWAAASSGQFAWEDIDRGVFTHAFTDGLYGAADTNGDDTITNDELRNYVTLAQDMWCNAMPTCVASGRGFAPHFSGDGAASLAALPSAPKEDPKVEIIDPIQIDDGAPASYRETLGFVTDLFAPSNDARLSLAINGGDVVRIGETVTFTASADRPGALLLLDVDPNGELAQIYPSRLSADGSTKLSPGQPLTIPNGLSTNGRHTVMRVTEPAGQGLLLALFIEGDLLQLSGLMPAGLSGGSLPNGSQHLFEISQQLLKLEADTQAPITWSATYLPYRIEP